MSLIPTLIGIGGPFEGEAYALEHLQPCIVGRSRTADISLRRAQKYRLQSDAEREADRAAKTISARHFQLTVFTLQSIEIKNLSVNGTKLDGTPVAGALIITDLGRRPREITFGVSGKFRLQLVEASALPSGAQPASPTNFGAR